MGYYLIGIGAIISLVALWATVSHLKLFLLGSRAKGRIVGVDQQLRHSGNRYKTVYFHPIIEFETADGHPQQFTYGSGSTRRRPTIGDEVTVIYDPANPQHARLNSFMGVWAGPLAAAVLGGGVLYGGIQMVFFGVK